MVLHPDSAFLHMDFMSIMQDMNSLRFSTFTTKDFSEYKAWYEDAELNKRLGPMDDQWLDHVLHETDGCEYSVFRGKELVAVVGIKFPDPTHPAYYITDFAIKPHLRNQSIGSSVLRALIKLHKRKPGQSWKAFVDVRNSGAKSFFEKNGWICASETPDEHGMLTLEVVGREGFAPPKA